MTTIPSDRLVTVFGASGFIGRYVVRALAKAGYRVRAAVRHPGPAHFLRTMGVVGQVQIVQANVRYRETVERALEGADACVNLVGILSERGLQSFHAVQAMAPGVIGEAAARAGVRSLAQVSAIGADADGDSHYARTKAAGEAAVRRAFPQAVVVRPSIVFGPEDDFFNRFAEMARFSPVLPLFGGGKTKYQPVYAADVAEAIFRTLTEAGHGGQTYELGGPIVYTFRELMEEMLAAIMRRRILLELPYFAADALAIATWPVGLFAAPPITRDQVKLLKQDNVVQDGEGIKTLVDLGLKPTALDVILPTYLERFRPKGQFEAQRAAV